MHAVGLAPTIALKAPDLQSGAFAAQPRVPKICYDKKRTRTGDERRRDTLRRTLLRGVAQACWTLAKHDRLATREGIPALVIHTRHFSCQITTKERALQLLKGSRPAPKIRLIYWEFREREPLPLLSQTHLTLVGDLSDFRLIGSITEHVKS